MPGQTLLFVAGFAHPPNEDAACWLVRDIMPLVRRHAPLARLAIVGSQPTARVRALAAADVTIAADVSDAMLRAWYADARVAVVPLRHGAGVKRKVVEALREGVPLVTTPIGAQGLPGLDAVAAVCGTAEAIAAAIVALLGDDALWAERSAAGIAYARAHFSDATLRTSLCRAMGVPDNAPRTPLPFFAGLGREADQGEARSAEGEGGARGTTLTRVASAPRPLPQAGEVYDQAPPPPTARSRAARASPCSRSAIRSETSSSPICSRTSGPANRRAGGAGEEAGGRQRQALEPAPGGADAEQRQGLAERVGALD